MGDDRKGIVAGAEGKGMKFKESELPCAETETLVRERVHVGAAFGARTTHFRFDDPHDRFVVLRKGMRFVIVEIHKSAVVDASGHGLSNTAG